jgi:hypothetical protein
MIAAGGGGEMRVSARCGVTARALAASLLL